VGFFGRRKSIPRLDELLPEEERKIESRLYQALQNVTSEDEFRESYIGVVQEGVRKEPHEFIYHYVLGNAYSFRGELEKAKEILEKASSLKPDDPRPLYDLGAIYYTVWNVRNEEQSGETAEQIYRWEKETLSKFRKSSISRESASANALHYFRKVLACQLHLEDRKAVEQHIRLIEALL